MAGEVKYKFQLPTSMTYSFSELQNEYEQVLKDLKLKQARLNYLSSFFETTSKKLDAVKQEIRNRDKKLKEAENRSKVKR